MDAYNCPYCGSIATIRDSAEIYGRSYGLALICNAFPKCDSFVGCHVESGLPKGTMAQAALRDARKRAHAAFDPIWKDGTMPRPVAYSWLSRALNIPRDLCHIGMFDVHQCQQVVESVAKLHQVRP